MQGEVRGIRGSKRQANERSLGSDGTPGVDGDKAWQDASRAAKGAPTMNDGRGPQDGPEVWKLSLPVCLLTRRVPAPS